MRWAVLVSVTLWACSPSSPPDDSPNVSSLRQAGRIFMGTVEEGAPGSLLGSTLVKCPGGGFVAGAPGTGTAWHSPSMTTPSPVGEGLGRAIACIPGATGSSEMLAGGDAGVRKAVSGNWTSALGVGNVLSLSSSDNSQLPLIIGYDAAVAFANASTGTQTGPLLQGTNGYGAVVQWFPSQARFAVTHDLGSQVAVYDYSLASGGVVSAPRVIPGSTTGFGRSLAVGNVLPSPGDELIIGANGSVFVYLNDASGPVMRLTGSETSFGASLAIAPGNLGIDRLLVGQPSNDSLYLFFGDAGAVYVSGPTPGEKFGASVAVSQGMLAVGAPLHASGTGAVYTEMFPLVNGIGEVQECQVGRACIDQQCNEGVCVGGVFCDTSVPASACNPGELCSNGQCVDPNVQDGGVVRIDAGTTFDAGVDVDAGVEIDAGVVVDAGMPDAGETFDGGSIDAGVVEPDAGVMSDGGSDAGEEERDAGVKPPKDAGTDQDAGIDEMIFTTSGCSETGALPLLALCFALLRRRIP